MPSAHPYVLLNYQGKTRDVMTLAHELGHGVHQVLAAPQGRCWPHTPLTLAETASVFGEMLTFQALLDASHRPEASARRCWRGRSRTCSTRWCARSPSTRFERARARGARRKGELTPDQLGAIWLEVQTESLGPAIELEPTATRPSGPTSRHFIHSPFYVYAYAFGDCLVNSLYALYQEAHPGFVGQVLRHAESRRLEAPLGAAGAVRPRCLGSRRSGRRASASSKA